MIEVSNCSWRRPAVAGTTNMNVHLGKLAGRHSRTGKTCQKKNEKLRQAPTASRKNTPMYISWWPLLSIHH